MPQSAGGRRVPAPQQKARQREEHRHSQIEPVQQSARHPAGGTGLERDMGEDHAHGRTGPHALDGRQEGPGTTDLGGITDYPIGFHGYQCARGPVGGDRWVRRNPSGTGVKPGTCC